MPNSRTTASATAMLRSLARRRRLRPATRQAMWDAIRAALPDVDLVRFTKMPREIEGRVNPLTLLPRRGLFLCRATGRDRRQFRRVSRDVEGHAAQAIAQELAVVHAERRRRVPPHRGPDEAIEMLATLDRQQGDRLRAQGSPTGSTNRGSRHSIDRHGRRRRRRQCHPDGVDAPRQIVAALLGLARDDTM